MVKKLANLYSSEQGDLQSQPCTNYSTDYLLTEASKQSVLETLHTLSTAVLEDLIVQDSQGNDVTIPRGKKCEHLSDSVNKSEKGKHYRQLIKDNIRREMANTRD